MDGRKPHGPSQRRDQNGTTLCNAKGDTCNAPAVKGKTKCWNHGGATPGGVANANFKHGKYSKYLPSAEMREKLVEAMGDPNLMEYRDDVALLQARLFHLIEHGESLPLWGRAKEAYDELHKTVLGNGSPAEIGLRLKELESLLNRGLADSLRWHEVYRVTEQMGRTKERQYKREAVMQQNVTVEQFYGLLLRIADIAKTTITDGESLRAFVGAINREWPADAGPVTKRSH